MRSCQKTVIERTNEDSLGSLCGIWDIEEEETSGEVDCEILPCFRKQNRPNSASYSLTTSNLHIYSPKLMCDKPTFETIKISGCNINSLLLRDYVVIEGVDFQPSHIRENVTLAGVNFKPGNRTNDSGNGRQNTHSRPISLFKTSNGNKRNKYCEAQPKKGRIGKVDEKHVANLTSFVFGRVFTRKYKKATGKYIGRTRLRCLSYGKYCKFPCQIVARRLISESGRSIRALLSHVHSSEKKNAHLSPLMASNNNHFESED